MSWIGFTKPTLSYVVTQGIWQVDRFAGCLSLRDLASLSCARKDWHDSIISVYSSPRVQQLVQAFEACLPDLSRLLDPRELATAHPTVPLFSKSLRRLWATVSFLQARSKAPWGPALAAAPGLHEDLTQLFTVSKLPYKMKLHFVERMGLRISCEQLMLAAHQQVAAVDEWVQVQQSLDMLTNLPAIVLEICCHSADLHLDQLLSHTPQENDDILQLAFNRKYHNSNDGLVIAQLLPRVTDPARLYQLLQMAVVRGHKQALLLAESSPAASQLAPSAVLQLMQAVRPLTFANAGDLLQSLVKLPAAATLSADSLVPLLQQAVVNKCERSIEALCSLPAAHHIPLVDLISMLDRIVLWSPCTAMGALCSLSAAAALTAADVMPLMSKATTSRAGSLYTRVLCTLPGAQHLPLSFYSKVLEWAVMEYSDKAVAALCSLPAATQVDAAAWVRFVHQSFTCSPEQKAVILCSMPAATQASPADFTALLRVALQQQKWLALKAFCHLPSAQQVAPGEIPGIARLVEVRQPKPAYAYGSDSCDGNDSTSNALQLLASLGSVQDMSADDFLEVINILAQRDCSSEDMLQLWFKCRAAHDMSMDILIQHMQEAVHHGDASLLKALCQVPAAAHMCNVDALLQLIDDALKVPNYVVSMGMLGMLAELPAAVQLSSRQLAGVLLAVVKQRMFVPSTLCSVPAASLLPIAKVADLVQTAMEYGNCFNVKLLCSMQVSQHLSSYVIEKLLVAALNMGYSDADVDDADYDSMVTALCSLSGAAEISNTGVLLEKALRNRNAYVIQELCQLPAARKITADALVYYLDQAVRMNTHLCHIEAAVQCLCGLPNANCIQKKGVLQLIQTAVRTGRMSGIPSLCQLRAAHRLSPRALLRLLQQLAPKNDAEALVAVTQLLQRVLWAEKYFSKRS